jgi:hypothetical protein
VVFEHSIDGKEDIHALRCVTFMSHSNSNGGYTRCLAYALLVETVVNIEANEIGVSTELFPLKLNTLFQCNLYCTSSARRESNFNFDPTLL